MTGSAVNPLGSKPLLAVNPFQPLTRFSRPRPLTSPTWLAVPMKSFLKVLGLSALCLAFSGTFAADPETLQSGVKIQHTKVGTGDNPKATDMVKVHYKACASNSWRPSPRCFRTF